jgi:TRAP-type transport system small permease protein
MAWLVAIATFLFRAGLVLAFAVIIVAVTVQVVSRNFLPFSPAWTEELTRFALLYLAAFGIGLAYRSGDLVNIDIALEAMPERVGWMLRLVGAIIVCGLAVLLIEPAWRFVGIGSIQTSPVLGIRMTWSHGATIVLLAGLAIFSALRVLEMLAGRSDGRPLPLDGVETVPPPTTTTPR